MGINPFLSSSENWLLGLFVIAVLVIAIPSPVIALVRFYHAGARDGKGMAGGDGTPDADWKAGMFYCNHDDPALWVPARFGLGYTPNFGNRWAWAFVIGMCLFTALVFTVIILSSG